MSVDPERAHMLAKELAFEHANLTVDRRVSESNERVWCYEFKKEYERQYIAITGMRRVKCEDDYDR